jgi:hypothetical protein
MSSSSGSFLSVGRDCGILDTILEDLSRGASNLSWCIVGSTAFLFHIYQRKTSHKGIADKRFNHVAGWKYRGVDICLMPDVSPNVLGKWLLDLGYIPYVIDLKAKYMAFAYRFSGFNLSVFPCGQLTPNDTDIYEVKGEKVRVVKLGVAFADLMSVIYGLKSGGVLDPKHGSSFSVVFKCMDDGDVEVARQYWNRVFAERLGATFEEAFDFCDKFSRSSYPVEYRDRIIEDPYRRFHGIRIGVLAIYIKALFVLPSTLKYRFKKRTPWSW